MSKAAQVEYYARIAIAVIDQAVNDARSKNGERAAALEWLLSDDCAMFCEGLAYNHEGVKAWAKSTLEGVTPGGRG